MPIDFSSDEMSARVSDALPRVGAEPLAFIQGYPFTRFADPGTLATLVGNISWGTFFDLRVFGNAGEWHAWNMGGSQWRARFWPEGDKQYETLCRVFPMRGKREEQRDGEWVLLSEADGSKVWLPARAASSLPPLLTVAEIVDYDPESGLAGVVDCALRSLKPFSKELLSACEQQNHILRG